MHRHAEREDHKTRMLLVQHQPNISQSFEPSFVARKDKVQHAEITMSLFIAEHNLAFSLMDHLPKMIRYAFPDSEIAKQVKCGRKKTTKILTDVIAPYNSKQISTAIRKGTAYSVIIDESTDCSQVKSLAIVVRFFEVDSIRDRFLGLVAVTDQSAAGIFSTLAKTLENIKLPMKSMIGFAADNASVMMGNKGGVQALLKEQLPNLFVLGCVCHSFALSSEAACKMLPDEIEQFAQDVVNYFGKSASRRQDFSKYQAIAELAPHRLLKLSQTRWLSLEVSSGLNLNIMFNTQYDFCFYLF